MIRDGRSQDHSLVVRVRGERGTQDRTFVWQGAPTGRLLGITNALPTRLRFQPEAGGGWAAFDRRSGESVPLRVEGGLGVVGRGRGGLRKRRRYASSLASIGYVSSLGRLHF